MKSFTRTQYGILYCGALLGLTESGDHYEFTERGEPWLVSSLDTAIQACLFDPHWSSRSYDSPGHNGMDRTQMQVCKVVSSQTCTVEDVEFPTVYRDSLDTIDIQPSFKLPDVGAKIVILGKIPTGMTIRSMQKWVGKPLYQGQPYNKSFCVGVIKPVGKLTTWMGGRVEVLILCRDLNP
jgi:hypothetical protein